jgi:hypothetical protein
MGSFYFFLTPILSFSGYTNENGLVSWFSEHGSSRSLSSCFRCLTFLAISAMSPRVDHAQLKMTHEVCFCGDKIINFKLKTWHFPPRKQSENTPLRHRLFTTLLGHFHLLRPNILRRSKSFAADPGGSYPASRIAQNSQLAQRGQYNKDDKRPKFRYYPEVHARPTTARTAFW